MSHTDFLVAMPSFTRGMGRVGDLFNATRYYTYNMSLTPEQADARAIAHDWLQVGDDLYGAGLVSEQAK
jgi:hypothetical protein